VIAYLDASALAKLFLDEPGSARVRELWSSGFPASTSELTVVELACALAAAARAGRLAVEKLSPSVVDGTFLTERAELVRAGTEVVLSAAEIGVRNHLRALDALHVASALELREADPVVVSWDEDQRRAAVAEGLPVYP
jgi:predicted nucleic acid-binding protein